MSIKALAERVALGLMTLGILMVWQPWVHLFFRYGFVVTLAGIVAFMVSSHMKDAPDSEDAPHG